MRCEQVRSFIFDFNGTLFRGSALHERAWQELILGKTFEWKSESVVRKKETIYRDLVLKEQQTQLIKGVTDYFGFLKDKQQLMNIATVSPKVNLDFISNYSN